MRYGAVFLDIEGASRIGIDTDLVDRRGTIETPRATYVIPDLGGLPAIVEG